MQLLHKNTGGRKELMHCPMPHTVLQKQHHQSQWKFGDVQTNCEPYLNALHCLYDPVIIKILQLQL